MVSRTSDKARQPNSVGWLERRSNGLFVLDLIVMSTLALIFLTSSRVEPLGGPAIIGLQVVAIGCFFVLLLSVIRKGIVSVVTCILGCVLVNGAIVPASLGSTTPVPPSPGMADQQNASTSHVFTQRILDMGRGMNFLLGFFMLSFGLIVGYRPSLLFARNRPQDSDTTWDKYQIWKDNVLLATGRAQEAVHVKSLMNDVDRYLLWRYEYVLVNIYDALYLVPTEGMVPRNSTISRDRKSGRIIGKPRFAGYFV